MKVPGRDVGRAEKPAVDPNEMQDLVGGILNQIAGCGSCTVRRNSRQPARYDLEPGPSPPLPPPRSPRQTSRLYGRECPPSCRLLHHRDVIEPSRDIIKSEPRPNGG